MSNITSSGPASKRKRTERDDDSNCPETLDNSTVVRTDIWFDDGNVILQAQNTQFRVHKSVISRHSNVFRDMFNVPQPDSEPTVDGCQVAHVMDEPEDWKNVLLVLYDGIKAYKPSTSLSLPLLGSMLRLGKKYEIDHLWDSAMERLETELPRSLDLWDKGYDKDGSTTRANEYHIFDLINRLFDIGIQSLLPVAYVLCIAGRNMKEIMWGSKRDDGTTVHLTLEAQKALSVGKDRIFREIHEFPVDWLAVDWVGKDDATDCSSRKACNRARSALLEIVIKFWPDLNLLITPEGYSQLYNSDDPVFCANCSEKVREKVETSRQQLWDNLPEYFGLTSWEDLQKHRWQ